jgi:hypothetical protein
LSLSTTGVRADGTWCAHYGTGLEGMNCGFYSFEQCRATVSGVGGFCQPIYSRQGNRDGVIGATISNAPPPLGNDPGEHGGMPNGAD